MKIPGLIDLQVNGYNGVNFSGEELTEQTFKSACRELMQAGTTAFLPTMITSPPEIYKRNLQIMAKVSQSNEFKGNLVGFHIEGPFLNPAKGPRGAHNPEWIHPCDTDLLKNIIQWSSNQVKLITIAADLKGAPELAEVAASCNITVSLGHHMADEKDLQKLVSAGAKALTHLGNGIPQTLPRHNNPLFTGLANDNLTAMIVTDSHHLPPSLIKTIIRTKTPQKCIISSDASPLAGMPPGNYETLGNKVVLEKSGKLYNPKTGYLVGSSATMLQCMNYMASLDIVSSDELIAMGFHNPLKLIGLEPDNIPNSPEITFDNQKKSFRVN
jgi:N-acetylglucosamine-6-phosphate deacetylase